MGQAGNLLSANDYYAYGALRQSSNYNSPKERFRFTEKERDTETSLDYFGVRYYACPAKAGIANMVVG